MGETLLLVYFPSKGLNTQWIEVYIKKDDVSLCVCFWWWGGGMVTEKTVAYSHA